MFDTFKTLFLVVFSALGVYTLATEPVEVEVWTASWCGPCRSLKAFIATEPAELDDNTVVIRDFDEERAAARKLRVSSLPTTIVRVYGREVGRLVGFPGARQWLGFVGSHEDSE